MKTIIAGSRSITDYDILTAAVKACPWKITSVVSGMAYGVDVLGERYSFRNKLPLQQINARWEKHGKSAGPIRNRQMARNAEALLALWDGKSKGTANMIKTARQFNLKVFVYHTNQKALNQQPELKL